MKKLISVIVSVCLITGSIPLQEANATLLSDIAGGLFTEFTYPIQLVLGCKDALFFRKQNVYVEKEWHKQQRLSQHVERKPDLPTPANPPNPSDNSAVDDANIIAGGDVNPLTRSRDVC